EDVRAEGVVSGPEALDDDGFARDLLVPGEIIQERTERIAPEDADDEERIGRFEGGLRPLDEMAEVEEKGGFNLGFAGARLSVCRRRENRANDNQGRCAQAWRYGLEPTDA